MFMSWISPSRRIPEAPRGTANAVAIPESGSPRSPLDVSWEAIVAQLRATPADEHANEREAPEYDWARRLGLHINRPPKRSQR